MVVSGIRWRCFISVVEGVVNVLYTAVMGWHVVMATFCICGWTTVVLSVIIHHGGVVWSWYEWSWLSYLVQYCCQTISWLLSVWIGMEMVCVWCVPPWWWYVFDDVCRHDGGMRRRRGRMDECLLLRPLTSWCGVIVVDGIVLMCRYGGDKWWWQRPVVEVGVLLFPHDDVWWCCYTWGWLLWLLIWCCCQTRTFCYRLGEGNLIREELIFSLHATGTIYSFSSCAGW